MRWAVVVFPGSNCDADCYHALRDALGHEVEYVWHQENRIDGFDAVILPGGFSYGDYLRAGAIARFSPVMAAVEEFARRGGPVLGICNGFQILCEAGLLPGALVKNASTRFRCERVYVRVEQVRTPFTCSLRPGEVLSLPIAHGEGRYHIDPVGLEALRKSGQIVFTYASLQGEVDERHNPNGSVANIAGVANREGNVVGLMPHPERSVEELLGGTDGVRIFASVAEWAAGRRR